MHCIHHLTHINEKDANTETVKHTNSQAVKQSSSQGVKQLRTKERTTTLKLRHTAATAIPIMQPLPIQQDGSLWDTASWHTLSTIVPRGNFHKPRFCFSRGLRVPSAWGVEICDGNDVVAPLSCLVAGTASDAGRLLAAARSMFLSPGIAHG